MIVTIDGPAGAGKSSAARELARRLGFRFLDTGAMYRSVTLAALERGLDLADTQAMARLAGALNLVVGDDQVQMDGRDVTRAIRTVEVTNATRHAADNPGVRAKLGELQQLAARHGNVVTEGRDQGSVVFPNAECKIFLTASDEVRAKRRYHDLLERGEKISLDHVLTKQRIRDEQDRTRLVGALVKPKDAIEVNTDRLSPTEVVDRLEAIVRSCQTASP